MLLDGVPSSSSESIRPPLLSQLHTRLVQIIKKPLFIITVLGLCIAVPMQRTN